MSTRMIITVAAIATLAGCGEYQQHVEYADGGYQGKKDQRAWDNEAAMHDRAAWKQIINERAQRQNEYARTEN